MIKINQPTLEEMEIHYPGIKQQILRFEHAKLDSCPRCHSKSTAIVQCGVRGRTTYIAAATTKVKLVRTTSKPAKYFCNRCHKFFN